MLCALGTKGVCDRQYTTDIPSIVSILILAVCIMSTRPAPPWDSYASDDESSYFVGSANSATETDSDVPGPGRLLGKAYGFLGRKAEDCISSAAAKLGLGPRATALKVRRLIREGSAIKPSSQKKLKKAGVRLVKHIRSATNSRIWAPCHIFIIIQVRCCINPRSGIGRSH